MEFALVAPIMVILMVAIVDLARVYTTMINVESAAREAADYAAFGSQKWAAPDITEAGMLERACVATSGLPDYAGAPDGTSCTNPAFSYQLSGDRGATWSAYSSALSCDDAMREPPCWVKVTLRYDFQLLMPVNLSVGGTTIGFPSTIAVERSSIFPVTDLDLP